MLSHGQTKHRTRPAKVVVQECSVSLALRSSSLTSTRSSHRSYPSPDGENAIYAFKA